MNTTKIKIWLFEFQNAGIRFLIQRKFLAKSEWEFERIGNEYSGYWFPTKYLDSKGTIWGIGLGLDSSFEVEMLRKGYKVLGFEPEKRCYEVSRQQLSSQNSTIFNFGLWDRNGQFKYTGDNISIVDIFNKGDYRDSYLDIRSLWEVAEELNLSSEKFPRVLRMNIEGAEREILLKLIDEPLSFDVIIFQAEFLFHLPFKSFRSRVKAINELKRILSEGEKNGWKMVAINRNQITLVQTR